MLFYGKGTRCKITSFFDSARVKLPKNITGISVIDSDRQNPLTFNFPSRNSLAKLKRVNEILGCTGTL